jgi:hypothetical protein
MIKFFFNIFSIVDHSHFVSVDDLTLDEKEIREECLNDEKLVCSKVVKVGHKNAIKVPYCIKKHVTNINKKKVLKEEKPISIGSTFDSLYASRYIM